MATIKLNKEQRTILANCLESQLKTGIRKPIHCVPSSRNHIDEYSKSYARYSKSMFQLLDAGIIEMGVEHSYAYIKDTTQVAQLLK